MSDGSTRLVLVTGATRGLGLAIAERLLQSEYRVVATGRAETASLQKLGKAHPDRMHFASFDLSATHDIGDFVRNIVRNHGPLYGLINNAAMGLDGVLATMHDSQIEEMVRVNVLASVLMAKYASRSMLSRRCGRIIQIASIIANTGFNGLAAYGATKAAMIGLTKSLARELGPAGITVNAVSPGYMATQMTQGMDDETLRKIERRSPLSRLVDPSEVASAVGFLLSDEASSITGSNVTIDAGSTA